MARYLEECLDSVAAIGAPHEHLVMDGGSRDGTVALLEGRDDPALQWVSEPDRGQTHAVNKGFERARGEFVGWLNADDAYLPDAVDRALEFLRAHPEVAAVFGDMLFVDEHGALQRHYRPGHYTFRRYLYRGGYITTPTIIFRRALLGERGVLDERWKDAADYDFHLRMFHRNRVEPMHEPLVRFRFHPESKTATNVWLQEDEALEIRQRWARNGLDRALMVGLDRAKRAILPRLTGWPEPYGRVRGAGARRRAARIAR